MKYGYSLVGKIAEGPSNRIGEDVFVLHPHQEDVVPAAAARPIPASVPPQRAVLAANMETALNALWDGGVGPADRVSIVGAGVVGLLIGYPPPAAQARRWMIDLDPARRTVSEALAAVRLTGRGRRRPRCGPPRDGPRRWARHRPVARRR